MAYPFIIMLRFSPAGAEAVNRAGLAAYTEELSLLLSQPPGNATIDAAYGSEDHDWDLILIGTAADLPGFWAARQLQSRISGNVTASKLIRLTPLNEIDLHLPHQHDAAG